VSAVATRWTSTWLSTVSVLQTRDPLLSVFTSSAGKERIQKVIALQATKSKRLKDVYVIVRETAFFEELGTHLDALRPAIESSLVMQGGSVTLQTPCTASPGSTKLSSRRVRTPSLSSWTSATPASGGRCSSSRCGCIRPTPKWRGRGRIWRGKRNDVD
jgi:hypothetical protein